MCLCVCLHVYYPGSSTSSPSIVCCFWHTSKTHWYGDETSVLYQHNFSYQYAALFNQSKSLKFARYKIFYTFFNNLAENVHKNAMLNIAAEA